MRASRCASALAVIFVTEDSPTRVEKARSQSYRDSVAGMFAPVNGFSSRLAEQVPTTLLVLTGNGLRRATDPAEPYVPIDGHAAAVAAGREFRVAETIAKEVREGDVLVLAVSGPLIPMLCHSPGESVISLLPRGTAVFISGPKAFYKSFEQEARRAGVRLFYLVRIGVVRLTIQMQNAIWRYVVEGKAPEGE